MFSFEFEIELNEQGRPIIVPNKDVVKTLDAVELKFMGLEIARAVLDGVIDKTKKRDTESFKTLVEADVELHRICDIFAKAVKDQMDVLKIIDKYTSAQKYDLQVDTMDDLYNLNYNGIIYADEIFKREIGLKVKVLQEKKIYELQNGIDNNNWTDITNYSTDSTT
jgi:hypothetical protein